MVLHWSILFHSFSIVVYFLIHIAGADGNNEMFAVESMATHRVVDTIGAGTRSVRVRIHGLYTYAFKKEIIFCISSIFK